MNLVNFNDYVDTLIELIDINYDEFVYDPFNLEDVEELRKIFSSIKKEYGTDYESRDFYTEVARWIPGALDIYMTKEELLKTIKKIIFEECEIKLNF